MANSIAVNNIHLDAIRQFQGAYSQTWAVKTTITWDAAVSANDTGVYTFTVPGVVLGDHVLSWAVNMDWNDGTDQAVLNVAVTAANTCTLYVHADGAEFANDALNGAVMKVLIGRPIW
jgi:hypothetical protein